MAAKHSDCWACGRHLARMLVVLKTSQEQVDGIPMAVVRILQLNEKNQQDAARETNLPHRPK